MKISLYVLVLFPLFSLSAMGQSCLESKDCKPTLKCRVFKGVVAKSEEEKWLKTKKVKVAKISVKK